MEGGTFVACYRPAAMPSTQPRILIVFGTRPEVIKLWPVDQALRAHKDWQVTLCNTGQHRELVPPILDSFGLVPEVELGVMNPGQSLSSLMARLLDALDPVLDALRFDWVVVQGDTTTALAATIAAYHRHVPVAHVEAGLRTHDLAAPFPEEGNRQLIGRLASLHLAPTPRARDALLAEGIGPSRIEVTGNTVVDAARLRRPKVACLGLTYKPDIDDLRESPALHIARALAADPELELSVVEPHLQRSPIAEAPLVSLTQALADADILVILVAHRQFRHLRPDHLLHLMVVDPVGLLSARP